MKKNSLKTAVCALIATGLSGCSTLSFEDFDKKNADLTMEQLLGVDELSPEKRRMLETNIVKNATRSSDAGHYALAARHARVALKLAPDDIDAQMSLADALLGMGNHAESEAMFEKLLVTNPGPKTNQGYGLALLAQNKPDDALNWLNEAVKNDPNLWRSWNGIGVIYDMSKSWKLSEQAFNAGLAIAGQNATLNNNLGLSYFRQNRYQEAIIAFENVHALPGGDGMSDINYRTALALTGRMDEATENTTDVQQAHLYNNLGVIAMNGGNPEKAVTYLKKAIETNPSYYPNAIKNLEIAKSALQ